MYCEKCYTDLQGAGESRCPKCGRAFDAANPKTFLARPFPPVPIVILQVFLTTLFAVGMAWVVALHQMARTSGH
jgi:hypothetical protein